MSRTISARRHSAKPLPPFEADCAALRAARHLSRRYNLLPATARRIVEAADIAMSNRYMSRDVSSIEPSTDVDNVIDFPIKSSITYAVRQADGRDHLGPASGRHLARGHAAVPASGRGAVAMSARFALHGADGSMPILELAGRIEKPRG
jgi:hypothetical protein